MDRIAIIILNYKKWQDTIECLVSLNKIKIEKYDVFIVDNFSNNKSLVHINNWLLDNCNTSVKKVEDNIIKHVSDGTSIYLIQATQNKGYSAGNNIGIKYALKNKYDYVLILNPDTKVTPNFLEPMISFLKNNDNTGMVGPKVFSWCGNLIDYNCAKKRPSVWDYVIPTFVWRYYFNNGFKKKKHNPVLYEDDFYAQTQPQKADVISGSCMLFKADVLKSISYFDENTFLYFEELIICEKLNKLGLSTYFIPQSVIFHKGGSTTSLNSWLFIRKEYLKSFKYYFSYYRKVNSFKIKFMLINAFIVHTISYLKLFSKNLKLNTVRR